MTNDLRYRMFGENITQTSAVHDSLSWQCLGLAYSRGSHAYRGTHVFRGLCGGGCTVDDLKFTSTASPTEISTWTSVQRPSLDDDLARRLVPSKNTESAL